MERIARDRLNAAICELASRMLGDYHASEKNLREFARAVAMVATTAVMGMEPNPETAVERMVAS